MEADRVTILNKDRTNKVMVRSHTWIRNYLNKMKSTSKSPLKVDVKDAVTGLVGGVITIIVLIVLTNATGTQWLMAPFGASCVLAFSAWNAPLSQPRNIIGGHCISTFVSLLILSIFGNSPWAIGLGVGLTIFCMMLTRTTHPPAGANPIVVIYGSFSWDYLFTPVLTGSLVIVFIALLLNNIRGNRSYPTYWL